MQARESLINILRALAELQIPFVRQSFVNFLIGNESEESDREHWDDLETFGIGDMHDDEYWNNIIDAAIEQGYLKYKSTKNATLIPTASGKKFLKKPVDFEIKEEDEEIGADISNREEEIQDIMADMNNQKGKTVDFSVQTSTKTKLQIKIIHAIDRKMALDDLAESEHIDLDELLDELEKLIAQGRKLDITYFTDEVLGSEYMKELLDYFTSAPSDNIEEAVNEFGDVYNLEELRLARVVFRASKL